MLKEVCDFDFIYRAGVWKPRTSPNSFQGVGKKALLWLQDVKKQFGIDIATEVANPEHVMAALSAGVDYLWIGARTSANPIAVQEIADALEKASPHPSPKGKGDEPTSNSSQKGRESFASGGQLKGIFIKNPVNEDAALWLGNIERLEKTGIPVMAVHRGCNHQPCWAMAHKLRSTRPDIPLLLDPSHMSGDATKIPSLMKKIDELQLNGAMIEVHHNPHEALSDARQQIKPEEIGKFSVVSGQRSVENQELAWLRAEIDELDDQLWSTITKRMDVSKRIGEWKKEIGMQPLQPERFAQIMAQRIQWAKENGLSEKFTTDILESIHEESLFKQLEN